MSRVGGKVLGRRGVDVKGRIKQIFDANRYHHLTERDFFLSDCSKYIKEVFQQKAKKKQEKKKDQSISFFMSD